MNRADAVLQGKEQPTVEDFIEWIEEEGVRMGSLGFRTEYANPEEIFANFPVNGSVEGFEEINGLEECATLEMIGIHKEIAMMERRMHIMKANRTLLARTEVQVDKRLLAAGKSQEDIDSYPNDEKRLRVKVMDLHALKHPIPPITGPPRGIRALLMLGKKFDRRVSVTLPVNATLAEVCKLLDGTCASEDYLAVGWHKAPAEKRVWKYHLIAKGGKSLGVPHSTRLLTDSDYQHLIQQFKKKKGGEEIQFAVLTPDMPREIKPVEETKSTENDDGFVPWNPLDENGVPYFDPFIDWGKVQIDEATGQVKEADLDRIVRELEALPK